ncbi:MAG: serine hydrolase [Saprospiraceae bacterium]|nr:serine hydrolase [Saprospiraceae bacterium]
MKKIHLLYSALFFSAHLSMAQGLYYPPKFGEWQTTDAASLGWDTTLLADLRVFLEEHHTKSFMVLKNGKIVLEYYFNDHSVEKPWYWASAGKSLTSGLVACAEADGQLDLIAPSAQYLGNGWSSCTPAGEAAITVRNHITMTTGLDDGVSFECTDPECLVCKYTPGSRWSYHNAPYTIIDGIIEGATGQNLNTYFKNRLGDKIGMTGLFLKSGYNNVFYSTARNMARYGLFVLSKGKWDGVTVLDNAAYLDAMSKPSQQLNPSYGYLWWLNGQSRFMLPGSQLVFYGNLIPTAPAIMFAALGKNDQKLYILPDEKLVITRMGDKATEDDNPVPIVFDVALWNKLSQIMRLTTSTKETAESSFHHNRVSISANQLVLTNGEQAAEIQILDLQGKLISRHTDTGTVDVSGLNTGMYLVRVEDGRGEHFVNKVIKN